MSHSCRCSCNRHGVKGDPRSYMMTARLDLIFFFSSRRRHTRLQGDWSSDVCSSDLYRSWHKKKKHSQHTDEKPAYNCEPPSPRINTCCSLTVHLRPLHLNSPKAASP